MIHKIDESEDTLAALKGLYRISREKNRRKKSSAVPQNSGPFSGNHSQLEKFATELKSKKIPGTVLITGQQGSGKTTFLGGSEAILLKLGYTIM